MYNKLPQDKLIEDSRVHRLKGITNHYAEVFRYLLDNTFSFEATPVGVNTDWNTIERNSIRPVTSLAGNHAPDERKYDNTVGMVITFGGSNTDVFQIALSATSLAVRDTRSNYGRWKYLANAHYQPIMEAIDLFKQDLEGLNNEFINMDHTMLQKVDMQTLEANYYPKQAVIEALGYKEDKSDSDKIKAQQKTDESILNHKMDQSQVSRMVTMIDDTVTNYNNWTKNALQNISQKLANELSQYVGNDDFQKVKNQIASSLSNKVDIQQFNKFYDNITTNEAKLSDKVDNTNIGSLSSSFSSDVSSLSSGISSQSSSFATSMDSQSTSMSSASSAINSLSADDNKLSSTADTVKNYHSDLNTVLTKAENSGGVKTAITDNDSNAFNTAYNSKKPIFVIVK